MGTLAGGWLASAQTIAAKWGGAHKFGNTLTQNRATKQKTSATPWSTTIANTAFTSHMETVLESPADAVRLIIPSNAQAIPNVKAIASTAAAAGLDPSSSTPTTANADGLTQNSSGVWSSFTWGGAATVNTVAGTSDNEPGYTVSDWLQQNSQTRTDASTQSSLPVHHFRILLPASATTYNIPQHSYGSGFYLSTGSWANDQISDTVYTGHRIFRTIVQNVDGVNTPASFTQSLLQAGIPMVVQYATRTRGMTVMTFGDSITEASPPAVAGVFNTQNYGWAARACQAVSTQNFPVELCQFGWGGQTSAQYTQRLFDILALKDSNGDPVFLPDVLVYAPWSPNDNGGTPTQAVIQAQAYQTARVLALCQLKGILPIIWTGVPYAALTITTDAFRQALNTQVRNMGLNSLYLVADFDGAVTNGANPERYLTGYSIEGEHPSDIGHTAIGAVLQTILQTIVNSN